MNRADLLESTVTPPSDDVRLEEWIADQRELVQGTFAKTGAVLFRGFTLDVEGFEAVTRAFSERFVTNGAADRRTRGADGRTQTVTSGNGLVPPHAELAYTPFRPDTVWLYCTQPSANGGETFVCDGVEVWNTLDSRLRATFADRRLQYDLGVQKLQWFQHFLPHARTVLDAAEALARFPGATVPSTGATGLHLVYSCDPVPSTRFAGQLAFANSVLAEPKVTLDGVPLSEDERRELFRRVSAHLIRHRWRAGDVLMIDNSRMMHGRSAFRDESRQVIVRLGFDALNDSSRPVVGWQ